MFDTLIKLMELRATRSDCKRLALELELYRWLDEKAITSENIGDIRRRLFMPWSSQWNSLVRDETAERENKKD